MRVPYWIFVMHAQNSFPKYVENTCVSQGIYQTNVSSYIFVLDFLNAYFPEIQRTIFK